MVVYSIVYNIAKETSQVVILLVSYETYSYKLTIRSFTYGSLLLAYADGIVDSYLHTKTIIYYLSYSSVIVR